MICHWATNRTDPQNLLSTTLDVLLHSSIYWKGLAGVRKLAIAQTYTEKLKESKHFGAAFFFTIGKHSNLSHLFTTITYQLATTLPDYRRIIDECKKAKLQAEIKPTALCLAIDKKNLIESPLDLLHYIYNYYCGYAPCLPQSLCLSADFFVTYCDYDCDCVT